MVAYEIYLEVKGANHRESSWHASKDSKEWVEGQDAPGLGLYAATQPCSRPGVLGLVTKGYEFDSNVIHRARVQGGTGAEKPGWCDAVKQN